MTEKIIPKKRQNTQKRQVLLGKVTLKKMSKKSQEVLALTISARIFEKLPALSQNPKISRSGNTAVPENGNTIRCHSKFLLNSMEFSFKVQKVKGTCFQSSRRIMIANVC